VKTRVFQRAATARGTHTRRQRPWWSIRGGPHGASRGQTLVEFALLLPALTLILALAGDFGRALTAYIAISSAAREGAAYGMMSADQATDTAGISSAVLTETASVWGTAPTVASTTGTDAYGFTYVDVTVTYIFTPILAVGPIGDSYTLTRTVRMRVIT
jgi:hypothetical protein